MGGRRVYLDSDINSPRGYGEIVNGDIVLLPYDYNATRASSSTRRNMSVVTQLINEVFMAYQPSFQKGQDERLVHANYGFTMPTKFNTISPKNSSSLVL